MPRWFGKGGGGLWTDWVNDKYEMPDKIGTFFVSEGGTTPDSDNLYLDIEHWGSLPDFNEKMIETVGLWRESYPDRPACFYGVGPARDYWSTVDLESAKYRQWVAMNMERQPLAEAVDLMMPSLYTFYDDEENNFVNWDQYAKANMDMAEQLSPGKRVVPFIWPQYHNKSQLAGQYINAKFWRHQIEFLFTLTSEIIIWGWNMDHEQEWIAVTKDIMKTVNAKPELDVVINGIKYVPET